MGEVSGIPSNYPELPVHVRSELGCTHLVQTNGCQSVVCNAQNTSAPQPKSLPKLKLLRAQKSMQSEECLPGETKSIPYRGPLEVLISNDNLQIGMLLFDWQKNFVISIMDF